MLLLLDTELTKFFTESMMKKTNTICNNYLTMQLFSYAKVTSAEKTTFQIFEMRYKWSP